MFRGYITLEAMSSTPYSWKISIKASIASLVYGFDADTFFFLNDYGLFLLFNFLENK